jgi:DNA-directed RNA polymerase subunit M/transcription elongation factor TFIIS
MHFCDKCGNMYYIRIDDKKENNIIYYCRKCGNENKELGNNMKNICVSKTHVNTSTTSYKNVINQFTKLDPTLPRINNINCPNDKCKSNLESTETEFQKKEIIFLRYDDNNMKYIYLCACCDNIWKNNENKT